MLLDIIQRHSKVGAVLKTCNSALYFQILQNSPLPKTTFNFIHESIYLAANQLKCRPLCPLCNKNELRFHNIKLGYVKHCSKCKSKSPERLQRFQETCLQNFGTTYPAKNVNVRDKIVSTKLKRGIYKSLEHRSEYRKYSDSVRAITKQQPINKLENFHKRGKSGKPGSFQLDHMYSVKDGFINNVSPEIIGHISNLQMLPSTENRKKWHNSSITLEQLLIKISKCA
jgi:hypothetical protein